MSTAHGSNCKAEPCDLRASEAPFATLVLRPALAGDFVPLNFFFDVFLRRDYFIRRRQLAEMLRGTRHRVLIAELDGVLVGAAVVSGRRRLVNLLIHPAYRRLGIGRALLRDCGAREVRAKCDMSTGDPRAFYAALGFIPTGERCGDGSIEVMRLPVAAPRPGPGKAAEPRAACGGPDSRDSGGNGGNQHAHHCGNGNGSRHRRAARTGPPADSAAPAAGGGGAPPQPGIDRAGVRAAS